MSFRIVEERQLKTIANEVQARPVFYVEQSENFLFMKVWNRFWFKGYETEEEARNFMNAMIEKDSFKPVIK